MERLITLKKPLPYFPRVRSGNLFGTDITICLPRQGHKEHDVPKIKSSTNTLPGNENIGFYDKAYNYYSGYSSNIRPVFGEENLEKEQEVIDQALDKGTWPSHLSASRRWYLGVTEFDDMAFFFDIWIYRNEQFGDLRQEEQLQKAHHYHLQSTTLFKNNNSMGAFDDSNPIYDDDYFDEDEFPNPESKEEHIKNVVEQQRIEQLAQFVSGVNWQSNIINGQRWLSYEEYENDIFWGESWLRPIGPGHYMKVRIYRMVRLQEKEPYEAIQRYSAQAMKRLILNTSDEVSNLKPSMPSNEQSLPDISAHPDIIRVKEKINELEYCTQSDYRLSSKLYESSHTKWSFFSTPLLTVMFILIMFLAIIATFLGVDRLTKELSPLLSGIIIIMLIGNFIFTPMLNRLLEKLKPASVKPK